jgi:hypothetical protein
MNHDPEYGTVSTLRGIAAWLKHMGFTDQHQHLTECIAELTERSEPAAASVPLLIDQLADRLEDWAQNEEMIDQFFLGHGKDCNEAAKLLRALSSAPGERTNKEKL